MAQLRERFQEVIDLTREHAVPPNMVEHGTEFGDEVEYLGTAPLGRIRDTLLLEATVLQSVKHKGFTITRGTTVELADGDFLTVKGIFREAATAKLFLKGLLFRRTRHMDGKLNWGLNEVCMILRTNWIADTSPQYCFSTRPCDDAIAIRSIAITNQKYPVYSCNKRPGDPKWKKDNGGLVCRWICRENWNATYTKFISESIQRPTEEECDSLKSAPTVPQLQHWTGAAQPKPEHPRPQSTKLKRQRSSIGMSPMSEGESPTKLYRSPTGKRSSVASNTPNTGGNGSATIDLTGLFTYGDIGAGGGGTTTGARKAGLEIKFMLDCDKWSCQTLRLNFQEGQVLEETIYNFCTSQAFRPFTRVDILHISYPCQPHSPAHTIPGQHDDANTATSYSVMHLLNIIRPRVVTFEQTSGIVTHNGGIHYKALLNQITSIGYSYRAKICILSEHGVSQPRKRLIIIAACPGETVPPFPRPTHGPGLRPFATINDTLKNYMPKLYPAIMHRCTQKNGESHDGNIPLGRCITTSGGGSIHPSGTRSFDCQELAALQSFPGNHQFAGTVTEVRRQIGNAVPPVFAEQLFRTITESMKQTDRKV